MKKDEFIAQYSEAAYTKMLEQKRVWYEAHPQEALARNREGSRRGGKRYAQNLIYNRTGLRGKRGMIRDAHGRQYRDYKKIIAPESQVHHQWIPGTSKYTGVALVENDQHMHGIIAVIKILDGEITLLTEEAIRNAR